MNELIANWQLPIANWFEVATQWHSRIDISCTTKSEIREEILGLNLRLKEAIGNWQSAIGNT